MYVASLRHALILVVSAWLAGCSSTVTLDSERAIEAQVASGDWASLSTAKIACTGRSDACAKAYAAKADACLRLGIQQPQGASVKDDRTRSLLDCAEENYRTALARLPSQSAPSRVSYHGGLLLTLSERRNRLDDGTKEKRLDRENEKLLMAAQDARREVAGSALGYLYGASAHAYRAALQPTGRDRCNDLRQADMLMQRSPSPPAELVDEQERIASLIRRELRRNGCPVIRRR